MNPFSQNPEHTISRIGETALLNKVRSWLGPVTPLPPFGMGDDCAVLESVSQDSIVTTDGLVYGCHFDDAVPPHLAGTKLLKRNLSDIAAMGGHPCDAVCMLLLAPNVTSKWLKDFYLGLRRCCETYGVAIVGGDLSEGPRGSCAAWITLWGKSPYTPARFLQRSGAGVGDSLWVTGSLGGSRLGHHLDFTPRLKEGQWLASQNNVHSMIDITDGLAKDLTALLPEGCDAALYSDQIPISDQARCFSKTSGHTVLHHALSDGEDYELLFTLAADQDVVAFDALWRQHHTTPLSCIGRIINAVEATQPLQLRDAATEQPLAPLGGFQHFSDGPSPSSI